MSRHHHTQTAYIRLDTHSCQACWECVGACRHNVLGKVDLPFHKHAHVDHADQCRGCQACVRACPHGAILPREAVAAK